MARKNRQSQAMHDDDLMHDTPPSYYGDHQKHPTFYTEDVFFEASTGREWRSLINVPTIQNQIDNTIFKFPKYHLRDSLIFERIFKLAVLEDDKEISGAGTAQDPFGCSTIDKKALEAFLALQRTACVYLNHYSASFASSNVYLLAGSMIQVLPLSGKENG